MRNLFKEKIIVIGAILLFLIVSFLLHISCPFRFFLGISCPGCGMTRAWIQVLKFDFTEAFYFHPLYFLVPFMGLSWLFEDQFKTKWSKPFWILVCVLFVLVYIIRFQNPDQNIVVFNLEESFFFKLYSFFIK